MPIAAGGKAGFLDLEESMDFSTLRLSEDLS
jgi:hypothetical protein